MRRINLLLQQPERKKYRKLSRWETLYGQIYGPKLVASNFALEPWSLALGGYFTRHGQRRGATRATARLLRQLYQGLRGLRGTHRWVLQLAEGTTQSHQRPEFLYSHLRQRFPQKNLERQRRWIKRLRRRALIVDYRRRRRELQQRRRRLRLQQRRGSPRVAPRRLGANPYRGTLSLSTVRQLPRLALLRHTQLQLWWETPQPLLTAGRYLRLRQRQAGLAGRLLGSAKPLRRGKIRLRKPTSTQRPLRGLFFGAWNRLLRRLPRRRVLGFQTARRGRALLQHWQRRQLLPRSQQQRLLRWSGLLLRHLKTRAQRPEESRRPAPAELRNLPKGAGTGYRHQARWLGRELRRLRSGQPRRPLPESWRHSRWLERLRASRRRSRRPRLEPRSQRLLQQTRPRAGRRRPRGGQRQQLRRRLESSRRLLEQLEPRSQRLEQQTRPSAGLLQVLPTLLRLQQAICQLRQQALQSFGYSRYKANWFADKNLAQLQRMLQLQRSPQRLQRCCSGAARALNRLLRRTQQRRRWLQQLLGGDSEGFPAGALRRTPRLQQLEERLGQLQQRLQQRLALVRRRLAKPTAGALQLHRSSRLGWLLRRLLRRLLQRSRLSELQPAQPTQPTQPSQRTQRTRPTAGTLRRLGQLPSPLRGSLRPPARRSAKPWRLGRQDRRVQKQGEEAKSTPEAFDPQQWRKMMNRSWPTLQPQKPYGMELYWEAPRSGQLGRWRRRSRRAQPRRRRATPPSHLRRRLGHRSLYQPARRLLRRRLAFQPQVHYSVRELQLQDLALLEEQEQEGLETRDFGQRYLLVTRRYGAVGYSTLLRDCFALLTPQLRLVSQVVGHKSARRTIYQVRFGVPLTVRVRALFGWLRDLVNKNEDYNLLRRNTARKPTSKRVRDKPERSRRSTQSFHPRLTTELRRLMGADEPLLEQLALFDSRSSQVRVPRRHYRWEG